MNEKENSETTALRTGVYLWSLILIVIGMVLIPIKGIHLGGTIIENTYEIGIYYGWVTAGVLNIIALIIISYLVKPREANKK